MTRAQGKKSLGEAETKPGRGGAGAGRSRPRGVPKDDRAQRRSSLGKGAGFLPCARVKDAAKGSTAPLRSNGTAVAKGVV